MRFCKTLSQTPLLTLSLFQQKHSQIRHSLPILFLARIGHVFEGQIIFRPDFIIVLDPTNSHTSISNTSLKSSAVVEPW